MLILLMALFASPSFADPASVDPAYYTITGVRHEVLLSPSKSYLSDGGGQLDKVRQSLVSDGAGPPMVPATVGVPPPSTTSATIDPYGGYDSYGGYSSYGGLSIMDTAMKIWDIVQKNKPVVTIDSAKFATALPQMAKSDWSSVGGFMPENNVTYTTTYTNGFGMEVVKFSYQVKVIYGGNVKGKGLYIASARIIPVKLNVLWGYNVGVLVSVQSVFNIRTPENPLAAIQMNVMYTISTVLSSDMTTDTFEMHGDGMIKDTKIGHVLSPSVLRMTIR